MHVFLQTLVYVCTGFINLFFFTKLPYMIHGFLFSKFQVEFDVSAGVWIVLFLLVNILLLHIDIPKKEKRSIVK